MKMRNILMASAVMLAAMVSTSCGVTINVGSGLHASYTDDLYGVHDVAAIAKAEAEQEAAEKAARELNEKRIAAMIAAANAESDIDDILGDLGASEVVASGGNVSIYNNIYVDDYSSAYARRLQGFSSMTYRLPSAYYDYRYGDAYFLTLAYDPAFYTVMVVGDQVWVEPRYITNMFGSWNNPYYYSYRYGYNPYYYGYSYGYYDYWGWNSPYWACDPFYHYHSHHYWHGPHYHHDVAHRPGYHNPSRPGYHNPGHRPAGPSGSHGKPGAHKPNVESRPSYGTGGGSVSYPGGSRPSYNDRLGGTTGRGNDRGATQLTTANPTPSRNNNGTVTRPGGSSARPGTATTIRGDRNGSGTTVVGRAEGGISSNNKVESSISKDQKIAITGTTLRGTTGSRGNSLTGTSNSSSRGSSSATRGNTRSSSSSPKVSSSSAAKKASSNLKANTVNSSSSKRATTSSSSSSSNRSSSSSSRSSSSSSRSSSVSSRSSFSGSSASFGGGSSSRSSSSSSSSRGSSRR